MLPATMLLSLAVAPPWASQACNHDWSPSMVDIRIVEAAISKRAPEFSSRWDRVYAGSCVAGHRVLWGRAVPAPLDFQGGRIRPDVRIGTVNEARYPAGIVDGTCLLQSERLHPARIRFHCLLA